MRNGWLKDPVFYTLATALVLPHGLTLQQGSSNTLEPKYFLITIFLTLFFINIKRILLINLKSYIIPTLLFTLSILSYILNNYYELTFISIILVIFSILLIKEHKFNSTDYTKLMDFIFPIMVLKGFLYKWHLAYNFGMGNPNHAGFTIVIYYALLLHYKKYYKSLFILIFILLTHSYSTILTGMIITTSHFFKVEDIFRKFKLYIKIILTISMPIILSFSYKYMVELSLNKEIKQQAINKAVSVRKKTLKHSEIKQNKFSLYHPSKITRVYQLDKLIENIDKFYIAGDEETFIKNYSFTVHNAYLGNIVIIGLIGTIIYIVFIILQFKNSLYVLLMFTPFFAFDTPTKINSYFLIQLWVYSKITNNNKC